MSYWLMSTLDRAMVTDGEIERIIAETLSERFRDVEIDRIVVETDYDSEDERILKIYVIFNATQRLDGGAIAGLARHLIPKIKAAHEEGFPVFSFVSRADMKQSRAASA